MKFKALLLALAVAGVAASFGLTDTGRSDNGTTTTGATTTGTTTTGATTTGTTTTATSGDCHRFEFKGTLASVSASSFSATVTKGNKEAKGAVGTTVTVAVTPETRVSWSGRGTLTGPNVGDTVKVNGKQCGTALSATKVDARNPSHENAEHQDGAKGDHSSSDGKKDGEKSHK